MCYRLRFSPRWIPPRCTRGHLLFRRQNPMKKKDFTCARITGQATSLQVKKKRFGNNCLKGMNIGSGWELKSIEQRRPSIFMIRMENSQSNQTVGRKSTQRLRTSFRKPQAVTLSSLAWRNRQQPARIGHWCMVSDKVDFAAVRYGRDARY